MILPSSLWVVYSQLQKRMWLLPARQAACIEPRSFHRSLTRKERPCWGEPDPISDPMLPQSFGLSLAPGQQGNNTQHEENAEIRVPCFMAGIVVSLSVQSVSAAGWLHDKLPGYVFQTWNFKFLYTLPQMTLLEVGGQNLVWWWTYIDSRLRFCLQLLFQYVGHIGLSVKWYSLVHPSLETDYWQKQIEEDMVRQLLQSVWCHKSSASRQCKHQTWKWGVTIKSLVSHRTLCVVFTLSHKRK